MPVLSSHIRVCRVATAATLPLDATHCIVHLRKAILQWMLSIACVLRHDQQMDLLSPASAGSPGLIGHSLCQCFAHVSSSPYHVFRRLCSLWTRYEDCPNVSASYRPGSKERSDIRYRHPGGQVKKCRSENKLSRIGANIAELTCPCPSSANLCNETCFKLSPGAPTSGPSP